MVEVASKSKLTLSQLHKIGCRPLVVVEEVRAMLPKAKHHRNGRRPLFVVEEVEVRRYRIRKVRFSVFIRTCCSSYMRRALRVSKKSRRKGSAPLIQIRATQLKMSRP